MIADLEKALKYFADFAFDERVPVALVTTTSGKFMVYYSVGYGNKFYESISGAINEILEAYTKHKNAEKSSKNT